MKTKRTFYCELAYILGVVVLALGTTLMERADFGLSMVTAPAYILHLKVSQFLPFFTFGTAGYVFQAFILIALSIIMRRVKISYFLSFATAFLFGVVLDLEMSLVALLPLDGTVWRVVLYLLGLVLCSTGVALLFHTYLPPEAYDLFVKDISQKFSIPISKTKTAYDVGSCLLGIVLSLCFFGTFVGVKWGTIVCTLINGTLIGKISAHLDKNYEFSDALPLRKWIK